MLFSEYLRQTIAHCEQKTQDSVEKLLSPSTDDIAKLHYHRGVAAAYREMGRKLRDDLEEHAANVEQEDF